jgi:hypothetical protein
MLNKSQPILVTLIRDDINWFSLSFFFYYLPFYDIFALFVIGFYFAKNRLYPLPPILIKLQAVSIAVEILSRVHLLVADVFDRVKRLYVHISAPVVEHGLWQLSLHPFASPPLVHLVSK